MKPTNTPDSKPTGSLEELFRHHLAEAEVPPRPVLWDQIDNSLLQAQNATYRRRLAATRWVAAASLLLATLAGTGWWLQRDAGSPTAGGLAVGRLPQAADTASVATVATAMPDRNPALARENAATESGPTATESSAKAALPTVAASFASTEETGTGAAPARPEAALAAANRFHSAIASVPTHRTNTSLNHSRFGINSVATAGGLTAGITGATTATGVAVAVDPAGSAAPASSAAGSSRAATPAIASAGNNDSAGLPGETSATPAAAETAPLTALVARPVALQGPGLNLAAHPAKLTALPVAPVTLSPHRWRFEASYAASSFNPNVDFSRVGATDYDYNPALGKDSPALTEAAAAEYRTNLRAGLGQRLALRASRRLGGHWAISTGLEVANNTATSRTSSTFVGEQVPDFIPMPTPPVFRSTSFNYQSAGLPVELRYDNPVRRGWSAYGRVGAVVSALLRVRSEVDGLPEAGRTYTIRSTNGDYRKVLANVRGGAGVRYQPAVGNFGFTLGPTAEIGLLSLNAHPAQDFGQHRAYSIGLEMGVEFGR